MNSANLPNKVKLVEVGPRDGLQNEKNIVPIDIKIDFINRLTKAGLRNIEAAAFVSPKWTPQMADSESVLRHIERSSETIYSALVPNMKGYERALESQVDEVVIFSAASEAFAQKNINCTIAESIERFKPIADAAKKDKLRLRGSISCAFGCPYQGVVKPESTATVVKYLTQLGCDEIDICDTIGVATAGQVKKTFEVLGKFAPLELFSGHFHDTYGQSLSNIYAALQSGVSIFHSSTAGLGGCPYAKGATGNVATEDVLYLLNGLGIETGIDLNEIVSIGEFISKAIGKSNGSRAGRAIASKLSSVMS